MSPKGIRDIKGVHAVKGFGSMKIKSGQSDESQKDAKLFQLDIEKDTLTKALEQFEHQKAQIEKRLFEIAQATQREVPQLEELLGGGKEGENSTPEKDDEQKKEIEQKVELKFGIGKISFSDIFQGIGSFIDLVARMEEEGKGEEKRKGEFTSPSGRIKAVYGFSLKEGLGGMPIVEPFGNVKRTPQGPVVEEEREPLVDVFDEKDHVLVIVELPGIEVKDLHTEVNGDILTLSAAGKHHRYAREVVLPKDIDANTAKNKYRNGVLEIRINKKQNGEADRSTQSS